MQARNLTTAPFNYSQLRWSRCQLLDLIWKTNRAVAWWNMLDLITGGVHGESQTRQRCSISSITTADPHGIRKKLSQILTKLKCPWLMIILHAPCSSVIFDLILSYNFTRDARYYNSGKDLELCSYGRCWSINRQYQNVQISKSVKLSLNVCKLKLN